MVRGVLLILMTGLFQGSFVNADEKAAPKDPQAENSDEAVKEAESIRRKARVDFLTAAVKHFEVRVGSDKVESKLHPKPLLVWNNPVSGTRIGILSMFSRNDRPDLITQFSFIRPENAFHEFHNVCGTKLELKRDGATLWNAGSTSTQWKGLEDTEEGAATPQLRLVQMRRLAERFVVEDNFGWTSKELHQLRLLPTPVYRYRNPDDEVVDGAVFVFALATDPEAVLMLECVKNENKLNWRYAFGPVTVYALTAKLDGKVVWGIGERRPFEEHTSVQYLNTYQLAEGEKVPE